MWTAGREEKVLSVNKRGLFEMSVVCVCVGSDSMCPKAQLFIHTFFTVMPCVTFRLWLIVWMNLSNEF